MVLLITGATHTGKTLLAQRMMEKYNHPYLSVDHLKMGLIRSGNTDLTPEDDEALTGYLWKIVREMIKTAIENDQHLIVEGCYIPFDWRKDFDKKYLSAIRFFCLALSDSYIETNFDKITSHESDIEKRKYPGPSIEELKRDNRYYINGFRDAKEKVFVVDADYEKTLDMILDIDWTEET